MIYNPRPNPILAILRGVGYFLILYLLWTGASMLFAVIEGALWK